MGVKQTILQAPSTVLGLGCIHANRPRGHFEEDRKIRGGGGNGSICVFASKKGKKGGAHIRINRQKGTTIRVGANMGEGAGSCCSAF